MLLEGLEDGQEGAALDPLTSAYGRRVDAEARLLAASEQSLRMGSWSGNPSDPTLHAALHIPEIPWGSGPVGTIEIPFALRIGSSGR